MDFDEDTYGSVDSIIRTPIDVTGEWGSGTPELDQSVPQDVEVTRKIGPYNVFKTYRGGMADVSLCFEDGDESKRPIALKSYRNEYRFNRTARLAFRRECAIWNMASLAPGVLPLYGVRYIDGRDFIAMTGILADSQGVTTLADLLRRGQLPLEQVVFQARRMADALAQAAVFVPGLVHGDLKPNNVLMSHGGSWISDFGLARAAGQALQAKGLKGTKAYGSPLAQNPNAQLSVLDDVYSFGIMLRQMLTGQLRQQRNGRREPNHAPAGKRHTHADLLTLADQCAATNPDIRPTDFRAVLLLLDQIAPEAQWPTPANVTMQVVDETHPSFNTFLNSRLRRVAFSMAAVGEHRTALKCIAKVEQRNSDWQLLALRAYSLASLGRPYAALWSYLKAYRRVKRDSTPLARSSKETVFIRVSAAQALTACRKYRLAERILRDVVGHKDNDARENAAFALGALYNQAGKYSATVRILRQHQGLAGEPNYWNNLGVAYLRQRQGQEAAEAYRRAIELRPDYPDYHSGLGQAYLVMALGDVTAKQVQNALAEFERAIGCGSADRDVFRYAATCALLLSDKRSLRRARGLIRRNYDEHEASEIEETAVGWARDIRNAPAPRLPTAEMIDAQGRRIVVVQDTR